jgi:hypothetical protein
MSDNQQVTKRLNFLVGTSETIRPLSFFSTYYNYNNNNNSLKDKAWNVVSWSYRWRWFFVSKPGYSSCEITMSLQDKYALAIIKQKLAGSIKSRSGVKALRYRLHNNKGMIDLVTRIKGNIRHTSRLKQLEKVCLLLNIQIIRPDTDPDIATIDNGWFSGFFDADGTTTYSIKAKYPQLTISVTNKLLIDVTTFKNIFIGNVNFDKAKNGFYKWSIQSKDDIDFF